jgi:D-sedoheptulose 7-phosphate isomerase
LIKEIIEVLYHTLWETVHVFFEHRELGHEVGEAGFLYPILGKEKQETRDIVAEIAGSIEMKASDHSAMRDRVAREQSENTSEAVSAIRERLNRGGKLIQPQLCRKSQNPKRGRK